MKKSYLKKTALLLSLTLSELMSITANAQVFHGNGYYYERDLTDVEGKERLLELDFDYELILESLTYKELCCYHLDGGQYTTVDNWFPIAIYTSADRAIMQTDALKYEEFYLPMSNANIGNAYQLIDGKPSIIEDISTLDTIDIDNLAFSLIQENSDHQKQTVGYINGCDMLAMVSGKYKYRTEKVLTKTIN